MAWSPEQVEILGAMGFSPYVRLGRMATPAPVDVDADRLSLALRRAARGRDLASRVADLEALRRDPQVKRLLWPQLRALRRSG